MSCSRPIRRTEDRLVEALSLSGVLARGYRQVPTELLEILIRSQRLLQLGGAPEHRILKPAVLALDKGRVFERTLLLNGIAGVVFGVFFWQLGLVFAMAAHFTADILLHVKGAS
jgi:hypothetical protein